MKKWLRENEESLVGCVATLLVLTVFVVVVVLGVRLITGVDNPNYCNYACRQVNYRTELVNECVKREQLTLDQCIRLVSAP